MFHVLSFCYCEMNTTDTTLRVDIAKYIVSEFHGILTYRKMFETKVIDFNEICISCYCASLSCDRYGLK
jgi:hypothetical protein